MTPEEQFNQEVLWILEEIKKEQLATPKGEKVEFTIRLTKWGIPPIERQRKLLHKLQEWGVLKVEIGDVLYVGFGDEPKKYLLSINQQKFDKFYKKWGEINENSWLSKESKITQRKELFNKQREEAETRLKEIRRQFKELDEKQKTFEELKEQISSQIRKELSVPIQFEEQIKKVNEIYESNKTPNVSRTSSTVLKAEQNAEIVSELRNINNKIEGLITQKPIPVKITEMPRSADGELIPTREPLHIVIDEVKKDIGIRGFEEKVVLQKPKNKKIQLRKFSAGLKWEEISIQFLNEHEVIIKAKDEMFQTTYEAMGFQDERKKLPNKQWQFLRLLALKNGEVSWENNQNLPLKQINSIKKQKQLLTEALKAYFQIYDNEPFQDYKTEKAYRIKITLTPEPELKDINEREVYDE